MADPTAPARSVPPPGDGPPDGDGPAARTVHAVSTALVAVSCAGIVVLTALAVVDVVKRELTPSGLRGSIEWSETLLPVVAFLALGYAQRHKAHVASTLVTGRLPERAAVAVRAAAALAVAVMIGWLCYETGHAAVASVRGGEYSYGLAHVPKWPAKVAICLGLTALLLEVLLDLGRHLRRLRGGRALPVEVRP
jgi:TRAP-type C4-dicarboxylate transport system permease small subunit